MSLHPPGKNVVHYPLDEESGGSWIALSDTGKTACLLNGAFEPFDHNPPYRQSRGLVVMDAVLETNNEHFLREYLFDGIAPFTLLIFEKEEFVQLVWDGNEKHITPLSTLHPQIWSSVTLYPSHVREARKELFEQWLAEHKEFSREMIVEFHQLAPGDAHNDFVMNRNDVVKTLSVTSIELNQNTASMLHLDLDRQLREEILVKYE